MNNLLILLGVSAIGYYIYTQVAQPVVTTNSATGDTSATQLNVLSALENYLNLSSTDFPVSSTPPAPTSNYVQPSSDAPILNWFSGDASLSQGNADTSPSLGLTAPPTTTWLGSVENFFSGVGNTVGNFIIPSANAAEFSGDPLSIAKQNLINVEGYRDVSYYDSQGILTGGIGHKILSGYPVGSPIPHSVIDQWFADDTAIAYPAAISQANDLGHGTDTNFVAALISVNFQLGTGWKSKFVNTYNLLKTGNWQQAINNLYKSAWYSQTPDRVQQFASAIQSSYGVG